jgi:Protein of unknown function (DUF2442)
VVIYDPAYFSEVTVDPEAGTIVWPGGIDLAPEPLYEQAKAPPPAPCRLTPLRVIALGG